jgi:hypothetical protein
MRSGQALNPIDVAVGIRLAEAPELTYGQLSADLGISASNAFGSVERLQYAGLLRPESRTVNRLAFLEFLEHGVRYAFPARPGKDVRGVPTSHTAPPLAGHIVAYDALVWPSATGSSRGRAIEPLYAKATELPERCPSVYESLTLVDALRVGRVRERKLAVEALERRIRVSAA